MDTNQFFQQITLELPKEEAETTGDLLEELGAYAVSFEDAQDNPVFEPDLCTTPFWQITKVIALWDCETDLKSVIEVLKEKMDPLHFATLKTEILENQDWISASLKQFKPQCFGNALWICPSWCESELKQTLINPSTQTIVLLDPGLAFGTGQHPTTQLCLEWLANNVPVLRDKVVLDFGCGSGILGIAAVKLGAKRLYAVDHDPQALLSTKNNALLNHINPAKIEYLLPEKLPSALQEREVPSHKVDLILANILANPLISLAPLFSDWLANDGQILLSGLLDSQADSIIEAYQPFFKNFKIDQKEEWISIQADLKLYKIYDLNSCNVQI